MTASPLLSVLLQRRHDASAMAVAISDALHLAPASVIELGDTAARAKATNPVLFELRDLDPGDFATMLYLQGPHGLNADSELASALARSLGERVLGSIMGSESPLSKDPYAWVLATPDGTLHLTYSDPDIEPGVVLDGRMEPWPPPDAETP